MKNFFKNISVRILAICIIMSLLTVSVYASENSIDDERLSADDSKREDSIPIATQQNVLDNKLLPDTGIEDIQAEPSEEDQKCFIPLSDYLLSNPWNGQELVINENVVLDGNLVIDNNCKLIIERGTVTVPSGYSIINDGLIDITGGELSFLDGAEFHNNFFTTVNNSGKLVMAENALYICGSGTLILDKTESKEAAIIGIDSSLIELKAAATNADELIAFLSQREYAFVTVSIPNPSFLVYVNGDMLDANHSVVMG